MIFRVPESQNANTSTAASSTPSPNLLQHLRQQTPTSEVSEDAEVISSNTQCSNSTSNNKLIPREDNDRPNLSYIETSEDPFEEIVIRAETFFPGLTNIAREVDNVFEPSRRQLSVRNSRGPNHLSSAEERQRGEQEVDRRIMNYGQTNQIPHGHFMQPQQIRMQHNPLHYPQQPQLQSQTAQIHYSGYYNQPITQPIPTPQISEPETAERTTYDYRNFQAARQRFEQPGMMRQPAPAPSKNQINRHMLRQQHSITSTVMSMGTSFYNPPTPQPPAPVLVPQPQMHPPCMSQMTTDQMGREHQEGMTEPGAGAIVRRERRNGGCGCGPGANCGALPEAPIQRCQITDREVIQKYLISEENGPGGIRSVFNFPDGVEPSDMTLLRAAIAANAPKDAFIPEENDDLEEQLNMELQNSGSDVDLLHRGPVNSAEYQQMQQQQRPQQQQVHLPSNIYQTGWRNGDSNVMTIGPGSTSTATPQRPTILKQNQQEHSSHQFQKQGQPTTVGGENPLSSLMYNGLGNYVIGPNSPQYHAHQMGLAHPHHQQQYEVQSTGQQSSNPSTYMKYSSTRFGGVPVNNQVNQQGQPAEMSMGSYQASGGSSNRYMA